MIKKTIIIFLMVVTSHAIIISTAEASRIHAKHSENTQPIKRTNSKNHTGLASWYGLQFQGKKTASGERYNMYAMTAAHKTLPIDSYVEVTNPANHRSVIVRINDRGPYHEKRAMDLSYAAAKELGINGVSMVKITAR